MKTTNELIYGPTVTLALLYLCTAQEGIRWLSDPLSPWMLFFKIFPYSLNLTVLSNCQSHKEASVSVDDATM